MTREADEVGKVRVASSRNTERGRGTKNDTLIQCSPWNLFSKCSSKRKPPVHKYGCVRMKILTAV